MAVVDGPALGGPGRCGVMGVLNVTPDSFSDGGRYLAPEAAIARGLEMFAEGASIVDVGGESTRPGARPVPAPEEQARVVRVVEALSPHGPVSVDTRRREVAEAALAAGAVVVNDVSASLWDVAAAHGAGWVAMHMRGSPTTMQHRPQYDDVVDEVSAFLEEVVAAARTAGVPWVWVDPGIGFGKTAEHNLALLARLDRFTALGDGLVVGTSHKSFLGRLHRESDGAGAEEPEPGDRLEGSLATAVWAAHRGASLVRVHDVAFTTRALRVVQQGVG